MAGQFYSEGRLIEREQSRVERPPVVVRPPKRPARLVRWLEWLVVGALVLGAAGFGYFLLRGGDEAQIRADLLGTRYREAGVVIPSGLLADSAEVAHLSALSDMYQARVGLPSPAAILSDPAEVAHLSALSDMYQARVGLPIPAAILSDPAEVAHLRALTDLYLARLGTEPS